MAKPEARIAFLQFAFALGVTAVVGRAAQLQLVEGTEWRKLAERNRTAHVQVPARRGAIYDRRGTPLAITQTYYHVGVAPNELQDTTGAVRLLAARLKEPADELRGKVTRGKYIYYHGPYTASAVLPLRDVRGVHLEPEFLRAYPSRDLAAQVVGRLAPDSTGGGSGIELTLDSVLTGTPGEAVYLKDPSGFRYESPARRIREPVAGGDVWLTIDAELQEIAERGLDATIEDFKADGGDVVILDPHTGEVLAIAARQVRGDSAGSASAPTFFTTPFEPGSTAKLFTAAALLVLRKVDSTSAVSGDGGVWLMPLRNGKMRPIKDEHREDGMLTLREAIHVSSNVAMAKFSERLTPAEQFEMLRAFGFGSPTGVEYPSESPGSLRLPNAWSLDMSRASIAMGYEFEVTPIQLASAYGAIANDGVLLAPALVREVRSRDGDLLVRHAPEPVRRVISPEIARTLQDFLRAAVSEGGTGTKAQIAKFGIVGKTGTSNLVEHGRYTNKNNASFAALFPASDPQIVVITKIRNPRVGRGFGGSVAAPAVKAMVEQLLSARSVAVDRARLAEGHTPADTPEPAAAEPVRGTRAVVAFPLRAADSSTERVEVPNVAGTNVRAAALALHRRGLRVLPGGGTRVLRTSPEAGAQVDAGTLVTLVTN